MSSCFSIAHQGEWEEEFYRVGFQWLPPGRPQIARRLPGRLTFRRDWRQEEGRRKSKKGFSAKKKKRDKGNFFSPLRRHDPASGLWNRNGRSCPVMRTVGERDTLAFVDVGEKDPVRPVAPFSSSSKTHKNMPEPWGYFLCFPFFYFLLLPMDLFLLESSVT